MAQRDKKHKGTENYLPLCILCAFVNVPNCNDS